MGDVEIEANGKSKAIQTHHDQTPKVHDIPQAVLLIPAGRWM